MTMKGSALLAALLLLVGCSSAVSDGPSKPHLAASFYPYAFVAQQVGGQHVDVDNLTAPGVEPHDLELKPQQVGAVQDADLVIYQRGFQAAVDAAVDQADRTTKDTIDVTKLVPQLPLPGQQHGAHPTDPHVWLDPHNMATITQAVRDKLVSLDPTHTSAYTANATTLLTRLADLDRSIDAGLKACTSRTIVTSHAAFGYFVRKYDLVQIPITSIDPGNEASPAQLARITQLVRRHRITTIFSEELVSPAIAKTIAHATGAAVATLDPIEGLSDKTAHENYLTLMANNLAAIAKANECA